MKRESVYSAAIGAAFLSVAVLGPIACGHDDTTSALNSASQIVAVSGSTSGIVNLQTTDSLAVKVLDGRGNPKQGITVNWAVTAGGGTVSPTSSVTDVAGVAKTSFKPGGVGANAVTASVAGVSTPTTFAVTGKLESFTAQLSAANEVPPNSSTATGSATLTVNATRDTVTYTISANNLTGPPIASHIHAPAAAGANASVRVPFTLVATPSASGTVATGTFTVANIVNPTTGNPPPAPITSLEELIGLLRSGQAYVNVHTSANKGGEIRGQTAPVP